METVNYAITYPELSKDGQERTKLIVEKFRKHILNSIVENKKPFLNILEPHLLKLTPILGIVYNAKSDQTPYILAPLDLFSEPHKWIGLCAIEIPEAKNYVLQVKSMEP